MSQTWAQRQLRTEGRSGRPTTQGVPCGITAVTQRALGKEHSKTADSLVECYPEWDSFQQICRECDPDGVFLNPHFRELSGV